MTALDTGTPVVVLHFHHGSLGIARSLGRLGVEVYGIDTDPDAPGLASRYCRGSAAWSVARSDPADSLRFLLAFGERIGRRCILVPASDDWALFVAEHADALSERFLFSRNPPELVRALCDKQELFHLCRRVGIPTPDTAFPRSSEEVAEWTRTAVFPVMLKGIDGLRLQARTGRKMVIVHDADELLRRYRELEDPEHPNLMLQEYIPGGDDTVWMFNGYFDAASECRAAFTGKKIRQHPVHVGATSLGVCLWNREVADTTARFMEAIGYRGILDVGYRYDARDGVYRLLDPNPRIGATFRLFVAEDGMDCVRFLYRDLTGQPLPASTQREGRRWLVEDRDLESSLDYAREGSLGFGEWFRSFRGVEEAAWFAWDDWAPFRRVAGGLAARGARRVGRRLFPARSSAISAPAPAPVSAHTPVTAPVPALPVLEYAGDAPR